MPFAFLLRVSFFFLPKQKKTDKVLEVWIRVLKLALKMLMSFAEILGCMGRIYNSCWPKYLNNFGQFNTRLAHQKSNNYDSDCYRRLQKKQRGKCAKPLALAIEIKYEGNKKVQELFFAIFPLQQCHLLEDVSLTIEALVWSWKQTWCDCEIQTGLKERSQTLNHQLGEAIKLLRAEHSETLMSFLLFLFEEKKGCDFTAARSEVRRAELLPQSRDGPSAKPVMKKQISVAVAWLSAAESASGKKKTQESGERVVGRENWRAGSDTELATWNRMYGHPSSLNKSILQRATNWADCGVTSAALCRQSVVHFKTPALFNYWTNCFLFRSATSTFFKPCVPFYPCIINVIFSRTWRYIYRGNVLTVQLRHLSGVVLCAGSRTAESVPQWEKGKEI